MAEESTERDDVSPLLEAHVRRFASLLGHARRRHGLDAADLDELAQEVRLRLWHAQRTPEGIASVSASYMYRTAMSAAVDLTRRRRREWRATVLAEQPDESLGRAARGRWDPGEAADLSARLEKAIADLPLARETAVRLHLAGYPREEIASLMGWTEDKTRNLVYRGLSDLRERLTELDVGPEGVR